MTKGQLIKTLEPFDDDIEIAFINDENYLSRSEARLYYYIGFDEAKILISGNSEPIGRYVELKIKG